MDTAAWEQIKDGWSQPAEYPHPLAAYRQLLLPVGGPLVRWNATSPFPCWRPKACNRELLQRTLRTRGNRSCSQWLQAHRCYDLPEPLEREPGREPKGLLKVACGRLVSRDECACQPCFTECRRSDVCPRSRHAPAPLPAPPSRGAFAYALMVVHSSESASAEGGERNWVNRYIRGAFRLVLSLRGVQAAHPIVLVTNLTGSVLRPFRDHGVQLQTPPAGVQPQKTSKACAFNNELCRRNVRTYAKLGFFALVQFDKIIALDTVLSPMAVPIVLALRARSQAHNVRTRYRAGRLTTHARPRPGHHRASEHRPPLCACHARCCARSDASQPRRVARPRGRLHHAARRASRLPLELGRARAEPQQASSAPLPPAGVALRFSSGALADRVMHARMLRRVDELPSHDGGDQGFLASFFAAEGVPWNELPRRYNLAFHPQPDEIQTAFVWHALHGLERKFDYEPYARAVMCNLSVACHRAGVCGPPRCTRTGTRRRHRRCSSAARLRGACKRMPRQSSNSAVHGARSVAVQAVPPPPPRNTQPRVVTYRDLYT